MENGACVPPFKKEKEFTVLKDDWKMGGLGKMGELGSLGSLGVLGGLEKPGGLGEIGC